MLSAKRSLLASQFWLWLRHVGDSLHRIFEKTKMFQVRYNHTDPTAPPSPSSQKRDPVRNSKFRIQNSKLRAEPALAIPAEGAFETVKDATLRLGHCGIAKIGRILDETSLV